MALRPEFTLEAANERGGGRLPGLFGFRVTAVSEESLDAELDVRPEILAHEIGIGRRPSLRQNSSNPKSGLQTSRNSASPACSSVSARGLISLRPKPRSRSMAMT